MIKSLEKSGRSVEEALKAALAELGLDEDEIVNSKMDRNEAKYPVDKARGSAAKYDEL